MRTKKADWVDLTVASGELKEMEADQQSLASLFVYDCGHLNDHA